MIHVTDLYPTILNLAGASLKQKHPLDGMNMWKTIVKGKKSPRKELVHSLPGNDFSDMGTKSIRQGPYKLNAVGAGELEPGYWHLAPHQLIVVVVADLAIKFNLNTKPNIN